MGGLVIKKAFILARQFQEFDSLARRVQAIFFLATPHRGADLAQTLSKVLNIVSGSRPFVVDLQRNSLATQSINDEFPQHCQGLQLHSFYETLATNYAVGKSIIVDKDLATLGYSNERTEYLNANHRDICKYASSTDPNYLTVRNALATVVDSLRTRVTSSRNDLNNEQRQLLDNFLGVSDTPEDDLMSVDAQRMRGSCEWLTKKDSFQRWQERSEPTAFWISAKPAAGKSVLAGYIIGHLRESNQDCSFYFFCHGDKAKATISSFLRSMAWQMALKHPEILQIMMNIITKEKQLGQADYRIVWRKLFLDGILRVRLKKAHFWIIDALDECRSDAELVPLLLKVPEAGPIRFLLTSRNPFESYKQVIQPKINIFSEEILPEDTDSDISLYLQANMSHLPSVDDTARQTMLSQILKKSAGCFLWVSLVLQELRQVHTSVEIREVLENIPSDMDELYSRILNLMSMAPYGKLLAKAILTWTVCSARPLTTHELYHALQIDIKDSIDDVQKAITASCGQLVYIDAQSRVQMVHQTARDFLLRSDNTSEFAIDRRSGHKRLAMTCLQYLNGNEMKGPRHRRLSFRDTFKERCPFVVYACNSLFEHVAQVPSTDDDFVIALSKFLGSSNVLSWIEYIAQESELTRLIQTGKAFRTYLRRRSKYMSPFGREIAMLDSWATDLVRLVTKFGTNLLASPSSVFHLIPPFCPTDTALKRQFAASVRGITVLGLSATTWDDCLSTIVHERQQFSALACSDEYFAVALSDGKILLYHEMTCQEAKMLQHREPVKILQFGGTKKILASSGVKLVSLWDVISWQQLWEFDISQQCISIAFADEDRLFLGALKNNHLIIWDLTTGLVRDSADWTLGLDGEQAHAMRRPIVASFCMELSLLAIVYRGQDILLWDLERDTLYATYDKAGANVSGKTAKNAGVMSLIFGAGTNATLLAVAYSDGDLVLFDVFENTVKEKVLANAQNLAASPDGRTLACGNSSGTIQLFDFETLKLIYRIDSDEFSIIKSLAFSGDSHRLLEIRGSQCRVWDPMVLVRSDVDEEISDASSVLTAPQEIMLEASEDVVLITSLASHDTSEVFFCGKEDGSICLYETASGRQSQKLFSHAAGVSIVALLFDGESQNLSSVDSSSRVMTHRLSRQQKFWEAADIVFDHRTGVTVDQILSNKGHTRFLVCSANSDQLYSITPNGSTSVKSLSWEDRGSYRWGSRPQNQEQLILITDNVARLYDWETLQELTGNEGILLEGSILPELAIRSITSCFNGSLIATTFSGSTARTSKSKLLLWNTYDFATESKSAAPVPKYHYLVDQVERLIGIYKQRLILLHANGWICSVDPQAPEADHFDRHFFIPADWLSTTNAELMVEVTKEGDVIFIKRDEAAVIKHGLDLGGQRSSSIPGKRTSLLAGKRPSLTVPQLSF